ncbi:MAG: tyrosine-type recombinase/integrase [Treponema sp.]|nr:tyrosine-type recombinase/integrase [Treponema sp.]
MSRTFKEPYSSLYEEYAEHERTRLSRQGFASCMGRTGMLVEWLEERKLMPDDVGIIQAMEFVGDVSKRTGRSGHPVTQGTICNYIKSARRFYGYLVESEAAASNPFMEVEYPRVPEHLSRNVLTEGQMFSLLEGLGKFNRGSTKRERARLYVCHVLAELMYSTGLRIDEASSLEAGDVNLKSRMVYVRRGKGGRSRTAFLSGFAAEVLESYIERGKDACDLLLYGGRRRRLFSTDGNTLMQTLNDRLRKICSELEIPVITSHGFRHSLGTQLLRSGCDMRHIQEILGHERLSSTQVYTRVYSDDLKESLDMHHPRQYATGGR